MTSSNKDARRLPAAQSMVLLIDWQERLFPVMPNAPGQLGLQNVLRILGGARLLDIPVVATEQYPQGIGATVAPILEASPDLGAIAKTTFSCLATASAREAIEGCARPRVVVMGMETHICVYQTVLDLLAAGMMPHVLADACLSRTKSNWQMGLDLCREAGAVITSTETVLFQWLEKAGGEAFKAISRSIR
jgi:nicotinamidase-related amidase